MLCDMHCMALLRDIPCLPAHRFRPLITPDPQRYHYRHTSGIYVMLWISLPSPLVRLLP